MKNGETEGTERITPEELAAVIDDGRPLTIIDVRQPEQYQSEHLPGAINIPLVDLPDRQSELDAGADIVTYCNGGNSGDLGRKFLMSEGFKSVRNLDGGFKAWKAYKGNT